MLLGAQAQLAAGSPFSYAFQTFRPKRSRALTITAAVKKRPPAQRSAGKQRPGLRSAPRPGVKGPQKSSAPARGLGGLFGGVKKATAQPKQVARKAAKEVRKAPLVRKAAPLKKAAAAGTKRIGGSQRAGGTSRIGTKRVGGTSRIGTKRTGAPPPGRIQLDEDTSSTLGAAGVFSLGLATAAFLLFSVFTGIEGTAEAEQVVQSATQSVKSAIKEVASVADSAGNQEDTKVAELANKAKEAASEVPSQARSTPAPQVADASPTGKAGIFGFGEQKPSAAEDTQIPNVVQGAKEAVEGKNPTPTSTKASEEPSQPNPTFNLASIFGQAKNEVSSVAAADTADNQEDTKVAELANKAKEAASQVPSQARSTPSPQVADQSPTGKAGIFGFGGQQPSAAEDTQVPSVGKGANEAVEGQNPTPTSSKAPESSQPNPTFNLANIFGQAKNEVSSVAAADTADNQEDSKVAELANKAKEAASEVPSQARSTPSPQVADASPTGKAGIFGFGEQKPSAAEDTQVPSVGESAKQAVEGKNPTPTSTNPISKAGNEVAKVADETPLEDAAEAARTLVPSPNGLIDPEKRAQDAEAQEKRAVDAPESSFRAASPVGGEGEVSNLADQGLKGNKAFEEAAAKLSASSAQQFKQATEVDKQLQAEDDFKRAAQFRAEAPGSGAGNSVIGRTESQITGDSKQVASSFPQAGKQAASQATAAAPANTNLIIGGGVVVAGIIAAAASQGGGGDLQEQAGKAAESVQKQTAAASSGNSSSGSGGGTGDIKEDIASRKKDAQNWIDDWKSRTGGK